MKFQLSLPTQFHSIFKIVLFGMFVFSSAAHAYDRGDTVYLCDKLQKFLWVVGEDKWDACPVTVLEEAGSQVRVVANKFCCYGTRSCANSIRSGDTEWISSSYIYRSRSACEGDASSDSSNKVITTENVVNFLDSIITIPETEIIETEKERAYRKARKEKFISQSIETCEKNGTSGTGTGLACLDVYWRFKHGGKEVEKSTPLYIKYGLSACKLGQSGACLKLAESYIEGSYGVEKSIPSGLALLRTGCEQKPKAPATESRREKNCTLLLWNTLINGNLKSAEAVFVKYDLKNKFDLMNIGHVYLAQGYEDRAIESYKRSVSMFEDPPKFWKGYDDDYQYIKQYGVSEELYFGLINKIKN